MSLVRKALIKIKRKFFEKKFKRIGNNVLVSKGEYSQTEYIELGNDIYIGPKGVWEGLGGIKIGNNVIIGPSSVIWTYNHNYMDASYLPYDECEILERVIIEDNVWIGFGVKICPGVTIGEGAVVAMGSVVTKDIARLSIVGGNPARIIGKRDEEKYDLLKYNDKLYLKHKHKLRKKYVR